MKKITPILLTKLVNSILEKTIADKIVLFPFKSKLILLFSIIFLLGKNISFGQTYTTIHDENWTDFSAWQGGNIPISFDIASSEVVNINHIVILASNIFRNDIFIIPQPQILI